MEHVINLKPNWRHCTLEYIIKQKDPAPDMTRNQIFHRAIQAAKGVENWHEIAEALPTDKSRDDSIPMFGSMQFKYNEDDFRAFYEIKISMRDSLIANGIIRGKLQMQYAIQLLLQNYIRKLDEDRLNVHASLLDENSVDIPELAKIFTRLILTDKGSPALADITKILVDWQNSQKIKEAGYDETKEG